MQSLAASALRVTLVQSLTHWHDASANRDMFAEKLRSFKDQTDLVLLPEMWSTGFTMASAVVAETMAGATVQWMLDQARELNCVVAGSVVIAAMASTTIDLSPLTRMVSW